MSTPDNDQRVADPEAVSTSEYDLSTAYKVPAHETFILAGAVVLLVCAWLAISQTGSRGFEAAGSLMGWVGTAIGGIVLLAGLVGVAVKSALKK